MKIFNWVHKRFHHNSLKDGFASNMKKTEPAINNADSQALLKQVALTESLGGWEDGILTIGTLGYDPLKSMNPHKEYFALEIEVEQEDGEGENSIMVDEEEEKCYSAEHEELNPLIYNTFEHNFEDIVSENYDDGDVVRSFNEIVVAPPVICHEVMESYDMEADEKKKKGERITLADLFLADSDVKIKLNPAKVCQLASSEKPNLKAKHGLSFAKKLIPRVKDNPHPMKDIKKLMKKMLKRKIHPDLDVKNLKPEGEEVSAAGLNLDENHMNEGNDSSYFLSI
ncbi:protein TILLER ANGLE CONTROL 1 [Vigna umbellata]|uniref:Protein TILLER ANGLE CONTROL 1 n=2 Tax=Phaseolus angularis TaxID=3914 RepID=A0A8T0JPJ4_PHAAN|nr:protein TILLER ANGLE CONTROL 1 [Vigna umbellata]KAG2380165.1 uncharacterized protein HKW66_Vig0169440 [Vigna angularis]BAT98142.1 hypothetical protein VIGAN_09176900 [Vigna angularis var. angularis]